jgi:hypothetical protein
MELHDQTAPVVKTVAVIVQSVLSAFSRQLNATVEVRRLDPGTEFVVTAPRESEL